MAGATREHGPLGRTIGIELEVESQETTIGPFRADIQLERTDHIHLRQLLTYAAGLEAVMIVWIASRFTEEQRAALELA